MRLNAGDKLGPYEILAPLGAGGMGEVYKARDARLDRSVAIKVSAGEFSERFAREARAIAALNHPHICTLHDIGPDYLVMEFIEGSEIKGPLPVDEAVHLAIQIAEAMLHAHRHGVIHRDLKPGNILLTKAGVKVLDFGLAKFSPTPERPPADATWTRHDITQPGTVVGTPRYMAPEQIEGRPADERSDVFAFGLILYEMLTGIPAFDGTSQASLIAAILSTQPKPVTSFQPLVTPALVHLIDTCLAKQPENRRQSMQDVLLDLRWIAEDGSTPSPQPTAPARHNRRELVAWASAGVASAAALTLGFFRFRSAPAPADPIRFEHSVPFRNSVLWPNAPAMSPDGRAFAYGGISAPGSSRPVLWIRRLDTVRPTALPGTEDATQPFWSPDGRFLAFFADGHLRKLEAGSGIVQDVCETPRSLHLGGDWSRAGLIVFGLANGPLQQVPSSGGQPRSLLPLDASRAETNHGYPHFLPDGRHFLYASFSREPGKSGTYVGSIDGAEPRRLLETPANVTFVWPGLLLFGRGTGLVAQRFDPGKLALSGEPFPVAEVVGRSPMLGTSFYSSSRGGALVYRTDISWNTNIQLAWYDREGTRIRTVGEPHAYRQGTMSPDERWFAAQIENPGSAISDIWRVDLTSGILSRLTSDPANKDTVVWSPDGRELLFGSNKTGTMSIYRKQVGGDAEQLVYSAAQLSYPAQWLKDGSILFMGVGGNPFFLLPAGRGSKPQVLIRTDFVQDGPRVSPDGRWVAYNSNESGTHEVYIAAFPSFTERRQVSSGGGVQGQWRNDRRELFYLSLDGKMMSVPLTPGPSLEAGQPTALFPTKIPVFANPDQYAVSRDGQRFLLLEAADTRANPFTIVLNWPAAVKP